ncbi:alpha-galactosidase [Collinsella sp. An2]|uniref:alpha-galactosidase n=1 Tax=Collinsella sp. An2 TaxID=1965585 RepID=UPI000B396DA6|nr:alpha-galactosidase [Collinsella sp. An2]OUP10479.1 alpha-galactosidase [Collinsella sp. An2]
MPLVYDAESKTFTIHTSNTTYQMQVDHLGYLLHLYYGTRSEGHMGYLVTYADRSGMCASPHDAGTRTYSLDVLPQEYPFQGTGDMRCPMLEVRDAEGTFGCDLRYARHEIRSGKYGLPGLPAVYAADDEAQTLSITLRDERLGLEVELLYGVLPALDIITRAAVITNTGDARVTVERAQTACLDFVTGDFDVISFNGRHAMERRLDRHPVGNGAFSVGSRRGMSSNQYNPAMLVVDHDATETSGRCWSMTFVYSGGFEAQVERDQFEQTRMQMGLSSNMFSYPLEPGEQLVAPEVILTYSNAGMERVSHNLHRCIRKHVCRGPWRDSPRPILINSWEAAYFDFTGDSLVRLAAKAAELGLDMLVMDDGWFGNRIDDFRALGDWTVNEEKLGGSLHDLVQRINDLGLKFGIWVEPEMVSEDSDLYRAHPDWALAVPGKEPVLGRDQLVLDLSRKEVRDNLFEQLCAVFDQANIEYVKWDYNRSIVDVYSHVASDQGKVVYDYMLGLYDLLERLVQRYPNILFEGCSAGGGRFDAGMMYYTPQIWTSDNTDADNRMTIQYGTSFCYPCSAMGAHVSACPNEINGRDVPLGARGLVAMSGGGFGYELDLQELPDRACDIIRGQVEMYREIEPLVREGLFYRLTTPKDDIVSWEFASEDASKVMVCAIVMKVEGYGEAEYVVPRGLTPGAMYRELGSGKAYAADALMDMGLPLPVSCAPYANRLYRFERID